MNTINNEASYCVIFSIICVFLSYKFSHLQLSRPIEYQQQDIS